MHIVRTPHHSGILRPLLALAFLLLLMAAPPMPTVLAAGPPPTTTYQVNTLNNSEHPFCFVAGRSVYRCDGKVKEDYFLLKRGGYTVARSAAFPRKYTIENGCELIRVEIAGHPVGVGPDGNSFTLVNRSGGDIQFYINQDDVEDYARRGVATVNQ